MVRGVAIGCAVGASSLVALLLPTGCIPDLDTPPDGFEFADDDDDTADDDTVDDDTADDDIGDDDSDPPFVNGSLVFDGDGWGESEALDQVALAGRFTIELYVELNGLMWGFLLDARGEGGEGNWALYQPEDAADGDPTLRFVLDTSEGQVVLVGPDVQHDLAGGYWCHVAVVRNGHGELALFVDGDEWDRVESESPVTAAAPLLVGRASVWGVGDLTGAAIDEIRISSTARYLSHFQPAGPFEVDSDTLLLWHLDECEGAVATDEVSGVEIALTDVEWTEG